MLQTALEDYRLAFSRYKELRETRDTLRTQADSRAQEAIELRAAVEDIDAVSPVPNEDTALSEMVNRLTNTEELRQAAASASQALSTDEPAYDTKDALSLVGQALKSWERVVGFGFHRGCSALSTC